MQKASRSGFEEFAEEALRRSEEEAKRLAQENALMAEIGEIISSTLNIEEVYEGFADEVLKIIPFDRIVINIINIEKNTVSNVYMAGKGIADRKVGEIYPLKGSGNVEMVRTKSTLLVQTEDFNEYKDRFPMLLSTFQAGFRSIMNVPLFSKGKIIGGLLLRSLKPYAYTDKDVRLAERVANQIAGAIANAQVFIERKRALEDREQLILQLQKALTEVKQLSGLLPICASCKKIRDDKGYWNQIESYIRDRSEAEFSHGICPDCMKKLYPDV
jgi:GAF domain-containing protein